MSGRAIEMKCLRHVVWCTSILLGMEISLAQDPIVMEGIEQIDSKERISGNAVVGFSYIEGCELFDPNRFSVHLSAQVTDPSEKSQKNPILSVQVTTVDGRYVFGAEKHGVKFDDGWRALSLIKKKKNPQDNQGENISLDTEFLNSYDYKQIAIVVSDEAGRVYPVACGCPDQLGDIRIQVNAEGADAYFPKIVQGDKRKLVPCNHVERGSNFKFDHYCDLGAHDIKGVKTYPIMRKRGATFDDPIEVRTVIPNKPPC